MDSIQQMLELVQDLVPMCRRVPRDRVECKRLADLLQGLKRFLMEMDRRTGMLAVDAVEAFRELNHALIKAQKVVKKLESSSKLKFFFQNTRLTEELRLAITDIQRCVTSLPLLQLKISDGMQEEMMQLRDKLEKLSKELKESESLRKDQQDLQFQVTQVLRIRNTDPSSSSGGAKVMDELMKWLAGRFHADVDTVRREWQAMKEEVTNLQREIENTSEIKRKIEDDLFQFILFIDSEEQMCTNCASLNSADIGQVNPGNHALAVAELEPPKEYICSICLTILDDPVIIGTGFTFCRKCIEHWYKDTDTCPHTRRKLVTKNLIANIALRNLIARWTEMQSGVVEPIEEPISISLNEGHLDNPFEQRHEDTSPGGRQLTVSVPSSLSRQGSSGSHPPSRSVRTYITLLGSNSPMQISKSLKELTSIASFANGQVQVLEAGGIPALTELLKHSDSRESSIAEKAAGVLEALTFELLGNKGERCLSSDHRDQICRAVVEIALDDLFDLMRYGTRPGCLRAAQTVINILGEEDVRVEIILRMGVVTAFYRLTKVGEGIFPANEGKALCIKGLNLLLGEKGSGSVEDAALTMALLHLSAWEPSPVVVEEALLALCSLVETGEGICHTLHVNKAIPFLVKSISRLPSDRGRKEALKILNKMSSLDGLSESIVENELFSHLFPVLLEEDDCLTEATRLLNTCLPSVRVDISRFLTQPEVKSLVSLLTLEQTSSGSKLDILSSLQYLCRENEVFRGYFLSSAGITTLERLGISTQVGALKSGVAQIMKILADFQSCHRDILRQGGIQLLYCLLTDDNLECRFQALFAAESLMTGQEGYSVSLDGFPFGSVVELLGSAHTFECREVAAGVLRVFAPMSSNSSIVWDRKVIELLLDLVRSGHDLPNSAKKKAADALLMIAEQDSSSCTHIIEADGLQILMEFLRTLGTETRPIKIHLLAICCKGDDNCKEAVLEVGGVKLLLEALEKGQMKEEAAIALGNLVESAPARQAVLQSNFIDSAVKCIRLHGGFQCSVDLTRALLRVLDSEANASEIQQAGGVKALIYVLEGKYETGRKLAATALTKLMKLDKESSRVFGNMNGIRSLRNLLMCNGTSALEGGDEIETLEALSVASEEHDNKLKLLEDGGINFLFNILSKDNSNVKELTLTILLNLSRENQMENPGSGDHDICAAFISAKALWHLFKVLQSDNATSKATYSAIGIVRNLSLMGSSVRQNMLDEGDGVVKVLLDRIRRQNQDLSLDIVQGAVMALEKFMLHSKGRMALIREGGIKVIVEVMQHGLGIGQAKMFATRILVLVAQNPETSKEVCHTIFEANVVPGLCDILEVGPDGECKLQACNLLHYLMYSGPRTAVCRRIREEGCIPKLLDLRADHHCHKAAVDVLELLKMYDRESKKKIREVDCPTQARSWSFIHK